MAGDIKIVYRIAEKQNKTSKVKPDWINNATCLKNAARYRQNAELIVFGDNLQESKELAVSVADRFFETKNHGNAETFIEVVDWVIENLDPDDIVYFLEDDYLHREGYIDVIREGLSRVDYVSLYDHSDKYEYDNEAVLFYTKSTHWRLASSTTMTFATRVNTLTFDYPVWSEMTKGTKIPPDFYIWKALVGKGRRLATPIPGFSTHGEVKYLSPVINWEDI